MAIQLPTSRSARSASEHDEFIADIIRKDPLGEFLVWWPHFSRKDVTAFKKCLARATRETDLQKFLAVNPMLLAQQLGGGHGRWVIPQKRLGCQFVPDFMVGEKSSAGFEWYAVELESPTAKMFTKAGDPSRQLNHAMRQISDWRSWLER